MPFVDLAEVRLHYESSGSAALPALVLSNSLGADLSMWEPQLTTLHTRFRLLRYDARGHGLSSLPTGPYSIQDMGSDLLGLLDALAIEQTSFCGLSMGGLVGQWLAIHAPERLHKLILANTAAKIGQQELWNARIATVLSRGLAPIIPGTLERWFTAAFHAAHPQSIATLELMLQNAKVEGYANSCAAVRDADFRSSLRLIQKPTLVLAGTHDPVTPPSDAAYLVNHIPGAQYAELPAAHLSNVEAPQQFNAALLGFLIGSG